jgi:hypothetical protein
MRCWKQTHRTKAESLALDQLEIIHIPLDIALGTSDAQPHDESTLIDLRLMFALLRS